MGAPVNATRSLALLVALAVLGCREAPRQHCVETLCFEWSEEHATQTLGHKHKLTAAAWGAAWIDVQSFEPGPSAPFAIASLQTRFARMRELTATARSSSLREGALGARPALAEDAVIEWRGRAFRRMTWLVPATPRWVAVDVTAPESEWNRDAPRLRGYIERARWQSP
jgi:hypothetical protein